MNRSPVAASRRYGVWRRIVWEGVRFDLPPGWGPIRVAPGHLIAGPGEVPGLELKTSPGPQKTVACDQLLRQLRRHQTARLRRAFRTTPLPEQWGIPGDGFSGRGFAWNAGGIQGAGAALSCRTCGRSHLIQFFSPPAETARLIPRILGPFRDHAENGWRQIRIFDLEAGIPPGFRTDACRFEPGRFELAFSGRGVRIRLVRYSPADLLLRDRTLEAFLSAQGWVLPSAEPRHAEGATDWVSPQSARRIRWLWGVAWQYRWLRAAHVKGGNRILVLLAETRHPVAPDLIDSIWSRYGVFPETP